MYADGRGTAQDYTKVELFGFACNANYPPGCANLGNLFENGRGCNRDPARAVSFYERACELGGGSGCLLLGLAYQRGSGVPTNDRKALEYLQKSCNVGHAAGCNYAAILYEQGTGVEKSPENAKRMRDLACKFGSGTACAWLGELCETDGPGKCWAERTLWYYLHACASGHSLSCIKAGIAYQRATACKRICAVPPTSCAAPAKSATRSPARNCANLNWHLTDNFDLTTRHAAPCFARSPQIFMDFGAKSPANKQ